VPEVALATSTSGFFLGSPYYSYRKALPDERKWQIGDTLYYSRGNHSFKFGVDTVHNYDLINNTYESNGDYSYTYLGNYINDLLNKGKASSTCNSSAPPPRLPPRAPSANILVMLTSTRASDLLSSPFRRWTMASSPRTTGS
jgi:hypothetical protein